MDALRPNSSNSESFSHARVPSNDCRALVLRLWVQFNFISNGSALSSILYIQPHVSSSCDFVTAIQTRDSNTKIWAVLQIVLAIFYSRLSACSQEQQFDQSSMFYLHFAKLEWMPQYLFPSEQPREILDRQKKIWMYYFWRLLTSVTSHFWEFETYCENKLFLKTIPDLQPQYWSERLCLLYLTGMRLPYHRLQESE